MAGSVGAMIANDHPLYLWRAIPSVGFARDKRHEMMRVMKQSEPHPDVPPPSRREDGRTEHALGHNQPELAMADGRTRQRVVSMAGTPPRYGLTITEARDLFREAGVPRSRRTLNRFCEQQELDCVLADSQVGGKYLIDPGSIDIKIQELQQQVPIFAEPDPLEGSDRTSAAPGAGTDVDDAEVHAEVDDLRKRHAGQQEKIAGLETIVRDQTKRIFDLEVTNRAKEMVIEKLDSERAGFIEEIKHAQHRLGELETRLSLSAGNPNPSDDSINAKL